jgi:hypothetical protein
VRQLAQHVGPLLVEPHDAAVVVLAVPQRGALHVDARVGDCRGGGRAVGG